MSIMTVRYDSDERRYNVIQDDMVILRLEPDHATAVVKGLFGAGLEFDMPDDQTYLAGELEATKKHLKDMRRLVFLENKDGDVT